jgi:hypothetical protein
MNKPMIVAVAAWLSLVLAAAEAAKGRTPADRHRMVLVEAEGFQHTSGWVIDQQFMDQMGSPFLLAHGLGVPVPDAVTKVAFPAAATYHVWVRTRDWVAPWDAPGTPGKFQVVIDGKPLPTTFGEEGDAWHWQPGGTVEIAATKMNLALHDLTGFEGRCDAILFSLDQLTPPNQDPEMAAFRRALLGLPETPDNGGQFDLVVVGGGIAGTCAALSAARLGLSVALVQDRPALGGNNSSEVRVWLMGGRNLEPWPRVGDVVAELEQKHPPTKNTAGLYVDEGPSDARPAPRRWPNARPAELYEDARRLALVRAETKIKLLLGWRVNAVERDAGRIAAVVAQEVTTGRRLQIHGTLFADCTGDGVVGFLAGADYELTAKGHMGNTNLWNVVDTGKSASFPRCPWAFDLSQKPLPTKLELLGEWQWESGFNRDPFADAERIRDNNFRAMYGAWDALKNVHRLYPNHKLGWAAFVTGKRESRHLLGDVILTKDDFVSGRQYPDGCVPTGWPMDLHLEDKRYVDGFGDDAFLAWGAGPTHEAKYRWPYWVPYRCFYSRNVSNLLMAGRDISVTHPALGPLRVQRTCGMMGEIVGMAASLCKKHQTTPRGVYEKHLDDLHQIMAHGVGKIHGEPVEGTP